MIFMATLQATCLPGFSLANSRCLACLSGLLRTRLRKLTFSGQASCFTWMLEGLHCSCTSSGFKINYAFWCGNFSILLVPAISILKPTKSARPQLLAPFSQFHCCSLSQPLGAKHLWAYHTAGFPQDIFF